MIKFEQCVIQLPEGTVTVPLAVLKLATNYIIQPPFMIKTHNVHGMGVEVTVHPMFNHAIELGSTEVSVCSSCGELWDGNTSEFKECFSEELCTACNEREHPPVCADINYKI